jgi:hypothetical protein
MIESQDKSFDIDANYDNWTQILKWTPKNPKNISAAFYKLFCLKEITCSKPSQTPNTVAGNYG